jgi:membrane protein implicated in regulation of membrane protease activity
VKLSFKSLLPTFVILGVGASGAAICVVATAISIRWLYHVGFVIAFLASLFFVLYLWWSLFIGARGTHDLPERDPHASDRQ